MVLEKEHGIQAIQFREYADFHFVQVPRITKQKNSPMPATTYLSLSDRLPLTCTRSGACCHGKTVWLNPWELARLAAAKGLTPRSFRDHHCEFGGIRLRFNSPPGWKGLAACSQYAPDCGCSVHAGRPLSCRLYPLGRERRGKELRYLHRGGVFPCLEECGDVVKLPHMTIADYLAGQDVMESIIAHDKYLELMQRLADGAFALLLESGLAASGDRLKKTILPHWWSLGIVAGFLVIGVGVKHLMNPDDTVVPGYFFFLACVAYTPMVLFYRVSRGFVNWQAFWFTLVVTVLVSEAS
jgi:Fe-S-cluster containining protein